MELVPFQDEDDTLSWCQMGFVVLCCCGLCSVTMVSRGLLQCLWARCTTRRAREAPVGKIPKSNSPRSMDQACQTNAWSPPRSPTSLEAQGRCQTPAPRQRKPAVTCSPNRAVLDNMALRAQPILGELAARENWSRQLQPTPSGLAPRNYGRPRGSD